MSGSLVGDAPWRTHTVSNQVPPLEGVDVFASNLPLVEAVAREGAGWVSERASALGRLVGAPGGPQQEWGRLANENKPVLRTFDRYGHRIDEVEFHPAWHQLMKMGVENELHSLPWTSEEPFAHTARAALYLTAIQAEAGFACPITMTFAVVPALRAEPELAAEWIPLLTATIHYGMFDADDTLAMRLSFDHRVFDGIVAAQALEEMEAALNAELLQECESLASSLHAAVAAPKENEKTST